MQQTIAQQCWDAIQAIDPHATGSLAITTDARDRVRVTGRLSSPTMAPEALLRKALRNASVASDPIIVLSSDGLEVVASVAGDTAAFPTESVPRPDGWADVLFQGNLPTTAIKSPGKFKHGEAETKRKIANCLAELGVFTPIVLDPMLNVIDGETRLALARELEVPEVPVIVFAVNEAQAHFLRLVLNRSSEFQSWNHPEVGDAVDALPNLQPLLEPLGFFGTRLLPVSYFSRNLIEYVIDETNEAQQRYRQETGLAEWAEVQRTRVLEAERRRVTPPSVPRHLAPKLFDLPTPEDEDFLATYDVDNEVEVFVRDAREMAFRADRLDREAKGQ